MSTLPDDPKGRDEREPDDRDEGAREVLTPEELQYAPLIAKLREWRLDYEVHPDFPIANVERVEAAQVRDATHIAPKLRVDEYAQQMRNGAIFPPVLVRASEKPRKVLIDGNTRLAAAKRNGLQTFPAIVVETRTPEMALILAAAVNMMGGVRLEPREAHEAAELMWRQGFPDVAVARELGRDLRTVNRWRAAHDVTERAEKLGVDQQIDPLNTATRAALVGVNLDAPFGELVKLFADVRPTEREARELAAQVVQQPSEQAAVAKVEKLRSELAPSGPPPHAATRSKIPLVRAHVTTLLKLKGKPHEAFDPTQRDAELERWTTLRDVCDEVIEKLRR